MFLFLEVKRNTTDKATGVRIRIGIVAGLYIKSRKFRSCFVQRNKL